MPTDNAAKRLPPEALDAFLDGVLAELKSPADPTVLNEVRAAFRKRVPFSLRSYAAAALILRAAGLSRSPGRGGRDAPAPDERKRPNLKEAQKKGAEPQQRGKAAQAKQEKQQAQASGDKPRARYTGEGVTLFFSMGKRQRFYPRALIDLLLETAGLTHEEIGDIRAFDNYSFADIHPDKADAVVAALDGHEVRGRRLSVNLAKKRDSQDLPS